MGADTRFFPWALQWLRVGRKVRRREWRENGNCLDRENECVMFGTRMLSGNYWWKVWRPAAGDLFAEDWELLPEDGE